MKYVVPTNKEYKMIKELLREYPNQEEAKKVLNYIRKTCKCIGCEWNDELPNSACYNCD